ncbi:hypothetical protein D3C78_17850 [compost metagenome]
MIAVKGKHIDLAKFTIEITNHGLDRWNERIGPIAHTKDALSEKLAGYTIECDRARLDFRSMCFVFDNEIVGSFVIDEKNSRLVVTSFAGRISQVPWLANLPELHGFIRNQRRSTGAVGQGIGLQLSPDILEKQEFPTFAELVTTLKVSHVSFRVKKVDSARFEVKPLHRYISLPAVSFRTNCIGPDVNSAWKTVPEVRLSVWGELGNLLLTLK